MKNHTIIVALSCVLVTGCSSSMLLKTSSTIVHAPANLLEAARGPRPVAKILCLWEPAEGQGLDEKPSRGFAGQIMFFGHGDASPMKVKGVVRIFEYVDYHPNQDDPQPLHVFNFDSGAWNVHRSEGTLGHSYNVFLPYVRKDKGHVVCALRVEIETEDGRKVSSPYTEVTLASRTSTLPATGIQRDVIRNASTETASPTTSSDHATTPPVKLESLTIPLPKQR
ncbi:MAG: hypothetical protein R3C59_22490 [Planctomycetaceae bacterium]